MRRIKIIDNRFDGRFRMLAVVTMFGLAACNEWSERPQQEVASDSTLIMVEPVVEPVIASTPALIPDLMPSSVPEPVPVTPPVSIPAVTDAGVKKLLVVDAPQASSSQPVGKAVPALAKPVPVVEVVKKVPANSSATVPVAISVLPEQKPAILPPKTIPATPVLKSIAKPIVQPSAPQPVVQKAAPEAEEIDKKAVVSTGSVQGSVVVLGKNSEKLVPNDVIVTLEPLFDMPVLPVKPHTYSIDMKDKRYLPAVIAVRPGDRVNFHNRDPIKHNVFSSSGNNAFDLGTYGLGVTQGVSLRYPGIVKVYCNIHAEMATFITINDKGYTAITKADGRFAFSDVPAGEYLLKIWHVRGETRKRFSVGAGKVVQNNITLDTTTFELIPHLNKHGKSYQVKPTLFKDEFY